jgi:hypothetical protein
MNTNPDFSLWTLNANQKPTNPPSMHDDDKDSLEDEEVEMV